MPTCPKGHDSATADYCDVCGARIGAAPVEQAPQPQQQTCPVCGEPQTGRFCERDGYDFLTASLQQEVPRAKPWHLVVGADKAYFEMVKAAGGPDAAALVFPEFYPERRFPLHGERVLIGRRSRSRGTNPDIDLASPPEDPGVSHSHAMLIAQPGGGWMVVDVGSSNGTYVNDTGNAITANVPVPLGEGDRIFLGAWTVLTVAG
jgi:FHA domain